MDNIILNCVNSSKAVIYKDDSIYLCTLRNVIDGDTVDLKVNYGFGLFHNVRIRLRKCQAPEIHNTPKHSAERISGDITKFKVRQWFSFNGDDYVLLCSSKDVYGRTLGDIVSLKTSSSLCNLLFSCNYKTERKETTAFNPLKKW